MMKDQHIGNVYNYKKTQFFSKGTEMSRTKTATSWGTQTGGYKENRDRTSNDDV